jgi:glycosyltransferase involved in cell wall biosynthesis
MGIVNKKIYSNFKNMNINLSIKNGYDFIYIEKFGGILNLAALFFSLQKKDIVILNIEHGVLYNLCFFKYIFFWKRFELISVDILLRRPVSFKEKLFSYAKCILLKKVDLFLLYFSNTEGYQKIYGISKAKIKYVPFKVNSWKEVFSGYVSDPIFGDYVLCAGQTLRDLKTFIDAMRFCNMPGVILTPGKKRMKQHGTILVTDSFPDNLRLEYHDDGNEETFLNFIKKSAIVVIPRFSNDISSTGISTYLCAMASWRCVIISKGPGADDVLLDRQAVLINPENPYELAREINNLWSNLDLRKEIAINGRKYAEKLQGEERMLDDILEFVTNHRV